MSLVRIAFYYLLGLVLALAILAMFLHTFPIFFPSYYIKTSCSCCSHKPDVVKQIIMTYLSLWGTLKYFREFYLPSWWRVSWKCRSVGLRINTSDKFFGETLFMSELFVIHPYAISDTPLLNRNLAQS